MHRHRARGFYVATVSYLGGSLGLAERALLVAGAALLFHPALVPSVVGLVLCGGVAARRYLPARAGKD